jgi:hypothetical protein
MNALLSLALIVAEAAAAKPVLDSNVRCLLGAAGQARWIPDERAAKLIKGGERYRLISATGQVGEATGGKAESAGEACSGTSSVPLRPEPDRSKEYMAIAGDWDPRPRLPEDLLPAKGKYETLFAPVLAKKGVKAAPKVRQLLRVDRDGDGKDEVIAVLSNVSDDPTAASTTADYSALLVRGIVNGKVETAVVDLEHGPRDGGVSRFAVPFVLDLDGDGRLEIVVFGHYAQGDFTTVYSFRDGRARRVMSCSCGG